MAGREIVVRIIGDASQFTKATQQAIGTSQKFGAAVGKGFGLGAGISAFNLLSTAISKTTDFIGDAIHAGMEEEASIARLSSSLRANVPAWDGRTDAIEKTIKAQMNLGFADEEQRDSMSRLVAVTHNVSAAQTLMRSAMDLARFKGIGLAEATQALINIEGGRYKALGALIGSTKEITSSTQALAAVQKVAGTAAADYAATTEGKALVATTKLNDKLDTLGARTLPLVNAGLDITIGLLDLVSNEGPTIDALANDAEAFNDLAGAAGVAASKYRAFSGAGKELIPAVRDMHNYVGHLANRLNIADSYVTELTPDMADLGEEVDTTTREVISLTDAWLDNAKAMIDHKYSAKELRLELKITKAETLTAQRELAKIVDGNGRPLKGHTWQEVNELKLEILRGQRRAEELTADLKGVNNVNMNSVMANVAKLTAKLWAAVQPAAKLRAQLGSIPIGGNTGKTNQGAATGGTRSGLTWVGEQGPELVNLPSGSYVHTASQSARMASGGGSGIVINVAGSIIGPSGIDELTDMMARRLRLDGV